MVKDFRKKVEKVINLLPPIPAVMSELMQAVNNPDADLKTIGKIIAKDPSMSMNVLKIANSAFYRLSNTVTSVERAAQILGTKEIASVCISCGVSSALKPAAGVPTMNLNAFWKHSVVTGVIAKILNDRFGLGPFHNVYLAGLIHDVGKIILDRSIYAAYTKILELACNENIPVIDAEIRVIGESHASVGGWLMEKWQLPSMFADVAKYHHSVTDSPLESRTLVATISLADQLAWLKDFGFREGIDDILKSENNAYAILQDVNPEITDKNLEDIIARLENSLDERAQAIGSALEI
jgi:HD-like signal output (HDOD) protein